MAYGRTRRCAPSDADVPVYSLSRVVPPLHFARQRLDRQPRATREVRADAGDGDFRVLAYLRIVVSSHKDDVAGTR